MLLFYASITLAVISSASYHVILKLAPSDANPALSLLAAYLGAGVLTFLLFLIFPLEKGLLDSLKQLNWASYALAFALVGLEASFLLAYRAGWDVSVAGILVNVAAGLLVIPIGLLFLKEDLSTTNLIGIVVCIVGLIMVNAKG